MSFDRVFLVGFMCSGKSTVGKLLAQRLGWNFYDVDEILEKEEKKSIVEIFRDSGECYFRTREFEVLRSLLQEKQAVISTGGGLGANAQALSLMKEKGLVLWIDIDFEVFLERCSKSEGRPLLSKGLEFVKKLFEERKNVYSLAHRRVDGNQNPESILELVLSYLKGD